MERFHHCALLHRISYKTVLSLHCLLEVCPVVHLYGFKRSSLKAACTNGFYTPVSLDNRPKPCGFASDRTRSYLMILPKEPVVLISSLLEVIIVNFEE